MIVNLITLVILVGIVALFAWLTWRAWKSKRALLKWVGVVGAGLLTLLFALVTLVIAKGFFDMYRPYPVAAVNVSIYGTPEQLARGEHLAGFLCASCHSQNGELPLTGGGNLSAETGMPLGDVYAPNITPAGKIQELSDADIFRILRTGVEPGGRLTGMSFFPVRHLSDDDAKSIIAYLRQAQPVQGTRPPLNPSPLFLAFVGLGFISPQAADAPIQPVIAPPKAANKEYGEYVASFGSCSDCHGPALDGNAPPPAPPGAPNLTVIVPNWSKQDFFQAMRTDIDPTGHQIQPPMPWKQVGKLDDVELEALYKYLHALTPTVAKK
ncbi:MAG: c-type cytochrome [Anaerolineae bacterium]|nr:c-type cytochrome [Anaerolineae bacterium]